MDYYFGKCIVIKSNQEAWLKPYIDINTAKKKKQKMVLKQIFLKY